LFILIIYISFVIDKQTEKRAKKTKNIYETQDKILHLSILSCISEDVNSLAHFVKQISSEPTKIFLPAYYLARLID